MTLQLHHVFWTIWMYTLTSKKAVSVGFRTTDKVLNADIKVCRAFRQVYGSNTIKTI